jgi:hypothetical protein
MNNNVREIQSHLLITNDQMKKFEKAAGELFTPNAIMKVKKLEREWNASHLQGTGTPTDILRVAMLLDGYRVTLNDIVARPLNEKIIDRIKAQIVDFKDAMQLDDFLAQRGEFEEIKGYFEEAEEEYRRAFNSLERKMVKSPLERARLFVQQELEFFDRIQPEEKKLLLSYKKDFLERATVVLIHFDPSSASNEERTIVFDLLRLFLECYPSYDELFESFQEIAELWWVQKFYSYSAFVEAYEDRGGGDIQHAMAHLATLKKGDADFLSFLQKMPASRATDAKIVTMVDIIEKSFQEYPDFSEKAAFQYASLLVGKYGQDAEGINQKLQESSKLFLESCPLSLRGELGVGHCTVENLVKKLALMPEEAWFLYFDEKNSKFYRISKKGSVALNTYNDIEEVLKPICQKNCFSCERLRMRGAIREFTRKAQAFLTLLKSGQYTMASVLDPWKIRVSEIGKEIHAMRKCVENLPKDPFLKIQVNDFERSVVALERTLFQIKEKEDMAAAANVRVVTPRPMPNHFSLEFSKGAKLVPWQHEIAARKIKSVFRPLPKVPPRPVYKAPGPLPKLPSKK